MEGGWAAKSLKPRQATLTGLRDQFTLEERRGEPREGREGSQSGNTPKAEKREQGRRE